MHLGETHKETGDTEQGNEESQSRVKFQANATKHSFSLTLHRMEFEFYLSGPKLHTFAYSCTNEPGGKGYSQTTLGSSLEGMMSPGVSGQLSEESQRCRLFEANGMGHHCTCTETSLNECLRNVKERMVGM